MVLFVVERKVKMLKIKINTLHISSTTPDDVWGGTNTKLHVFLNSALSRVEWPTSGSGCFKPAKDPLVPYVLGTGLGP
jgi:hypothetical protein